MLTFDFPEITLKSRQRDTVVREGDFDGVFIIAAKDAAVSVLECDIRGRTREMPLPRDAENRCWQLDHRGMLLWVFEPKRQDDIFELMSQARKALEPLPRYRIRRLLLMTEGFDQRDSERLLDGFLSALLATQCRLPDYRAKAADFFPIKVIEIAGAGADNLSLQRRLAEAEGNALGRFLGILPGSELSPTRYRRFVAGMADKHGWEHHEYDQKTLTEMGAGAFMAVAKGSDDEGAAIVRVRYRPDKATRRIALVGKGICLDTGGYNLKTDGHMFGMHQDMGGSAAALGCLLAISRLHLPIAVDCYLAICENHISPKAYKANDLVRALNGDTIEVVDTDAEGRMVLADTLYLASQGGPEQLLDYATLTGSCIKALGTRVSGVFTNRPEWNGPLIEAGQASGERVWAMPMFADYDENIESPVADIRQCNPGSSSDHIDAARFLGRHVGNVPWIHVDLSAWQNKGGLAHVPTETTGFGVRFTLEWLLGEYGC